MFETFLLSVDLYMIIETYRLCDSAMCHVYYEKSIITLYATYKGKINIFFPNFKVLQ